MILVTGLEPYKDYLKNPSAELVKVIQARGREIRGVVLPTEYQKAGKMIVSLLKRLRPEIYLGFGYSSKLDCLRVERKAFNWDESETADNTGEIRNGAPIIKTTPKIYESNFPLEEFRKFLVKNGFQAIIGETSSRFICNHVFYLALHQANESNLRTKVGFCHLSKDSLNWSKKRLKRLGEAVDEFLTKIA